MAGIDYETEYSPSRRVPEYLSILEGWARDAAAYRAEMTAAGRAELDLAFGNSERQKLDLFFPRTESGGALALFIHGGWWQMMDRSAHSHMARGLNAQRCHGRGHELRSDAAGSGCHDRRTNAPRLPVPVAASWQAACRLRSFRRRASDRRHGSDRLAGAGSACRSDCGRLLRSPARSTSNRFSARR